MSWSSTTMVCATALFIWGPSPIAPWLLCGISAVVAFIAEVTRTNEHRPPASSERQDDA